MDYQIGVPLEGLAELGRIAAAQGAVLLRNEGQALPLKKQERVSVFGRIQRDYYRSGTGSGGAVNVSYATNLLDGLREGKRVRVNEKLAGIYERWIDEHPFDNGGGGWAAEPWCQEEMPLTPEIVKEAAAESEKALIVLGRTAGEDQDNSCKPGSYLLTDLENDMIDQVVQYFSSVIVVLNVANIIDTSWLEKPEWRDKIKGLIYVWQGGMEGGRAAADVLTGIVTPCGKLSSTIAYSISDYPSDANHGDPVKNYYEEDIYVGYRYFETFCPQNVQFPFGFGLSYTDFVIRATEGKIGEDSLVLEAEVENTGRQYNGREVVQVYLEAPQGRLGRPARELVGFAKTGVLECGGRQKVRITIPWERIAAYDDSGITGHKSCYVLEPGEYRFHLGNSVRNTQPVKIKGKECLLLEETKVLRELEEVCAPTETMRRIKPGGKRTDGTYELTYEAVPQQTVDMEKRIVQRLPETFAISGKNGITLQDVAAGKASMEAFIAQLTKEELAAIVRGEGMCSIKVTPGTASAFGGITESLLAYGIPAGCCADGPSGIRMDTGAYATQLPIGTLLACTFDVPLVRMLFTWQGKELVRNEVDTLLGPGINIQRHPLNGRNFEYFSEDPLVTGAFAAAISEGIGRSGAKATIKHYACNSQESHRFVINAVVSERALRQIYLKGFELAVREGKAASVMTAYNAINGHWCASNYDLNTTLLRKEWGFTGIVMTDWWARMNDVVYGGAESKTDTRDMVRAQNDLYMVVPNDGAEGNVNGDNTLESLETGRLTVGELQRSAANICRFLMQAPAFLRKPEWKQRREEIRKYTAMAEGCEDSQRVSINGMKIHVSMEDADKVCFEVREAGTYQVINSIMSKESSVAQMVCKAELNGEPLVTFQTNGTGGRFIHQQLLQVELEKGFYLLELEFVKPGMIVQCMDFEKVSAN